MEKVFPSWMARMRSGDYSRQNPEKEKEMSSIFHPITVLLPIFTSKYALSDSIEKENLGENIQYFKNVLTMKIEFDNYGLENDHSEVNDDPTNLEEPVINVRFSENFRTLFLEKTVSLERISFNGMYFSHSIELLDRIEISKSLLKNEFWHPKSFCLGTACPFMEDPPKDPMTSSTSEPLNLIDYLRSFIRKFPFFHFNQILSSLKTKGPEKQDIPSFGDHFSFQGVWIEQKQKTPSI